MRSARLLLLCAMLAVGAQAPAAEPAATVTATPPSEAAVKPLTPTQALHKRCYEAARRAHSGKNEREAYVNACMKGRKS
jgi:hypothetical protein